MNKKSKSTEEINYLIQEKSIEMLKELDELILARTTNDKKIKKLDKGNSANQDKDNN